MKGKPGWEIEAIVLGGVPTVRVRHHGVLVAYCTMGAELESVLGRHGITLADLVEVAEPDRG